MGKSLRGKRRRSDDNASVENTCAPSDRTCDSHVPEKIAAKKTRNSRYILAGLISLMTCLLYLPSLRNEFLLWDDGEYVTHNPLIRSISSDLIKSAFLEFHASNWHPLTWISHALDYAIWGLNPLGHHLTNVILHSVNTALVVLLTIRIVELYRERTASGEASTWLKGKDILITGGVTGLLFGLHPVHVESVAWVAERKDLLCALFFLMSILAYLNYVHGKSHALAKRTLGSGRFNASYCLCLGFFLLALLSKPMAVSLPFVLLIIDWYPFERIRSISSFRSALLEKLPLFLFSLGTSVLTVLAQKEGGAMEILKAVTLQSRLVVAAHSLSAYLLKIVCPINLSPFYGYPDDISLISLRYLLPVIFVVGFSAYVILTAPNNKLLFSTWCYFVITLMPVLGFVQVGPQSMADRYAYLPSLSIFFLIALSAARISGKIAASRNGASYTSIAGVAAATVLIIFGYLTVRQIGLWKNDLILWSYAINIERSATAYWNRGIAFSRTGHYDEAIEDYSAAIALNHDFRGAYLKRGLDYIQIGQFDNAVEDFKKACSLGSREGCGALRIFTKR